jgi:adenine-specific DNA-methyltransferase
LDRSSGGGRKNDARRISTRSRSYIWVYARDLPFLKDHDVKWRERKVGLDDVSAEEKQLLDNVYGEKDYENATTELREWFESPSRGKFGQATPALPVFIDNRGVWYPDNISSPTCVKT